MSTPATSVSVISRHTVSCSNETSWTALESPFRLGPLDQLVAPFIPIAVVFVYPSSNPHAEIIPLARLERALTLLLDYYPHLTGRLRIDTDDGTPEITRLGTGVELLEAQCHERLDALSAPSLEHSPYHRISMPNLPHSGNALFAPFDSSMGGVCSNPILTIQHTRFACGGVALGVRVVHKVCDAEGFFQLVRDLAELYCGDVPTLAHPPCIRSYMSEVTGERSTLNFQPSLFYVDDQAAAVAVAATATPLPPVAGRFLRFSSHELDAIKAHATNPTSPGWVSTFDALSAHLYQCVYRARLQLRTNDPSLGPMSPPDFLTPVNLRTRLDTLPPHYFPNALLCLSTSLPLDVLADGPLWQIAKELHDLTRTTASTSTDEIDKTLKWIAMQPEKDKIRDRFRYGNGSFMVSQWNKFDMYPEFDVAPVLVSSPFTPISLVDGLVYFLPTETQATGDIDVNMSLSEPLWDILDVCGEFRRFRRE